jgi:DNA-binding PadR family transcriptional regulator
LHRTQSFLPLTPLSHAVLLALADGSLHGYAIMKDIEEQTVARVRAGTGTLYAALQRMMDQGLIVEADRPPDPGDDARRRYYALTELGRAVARAEARRLADVLTLAQQKQLGPEPMPDETDLPWIAEY